MHCFFFGHDYEMTILMNGVKYRICKKCSKTYKHYETSSYQNEHWKEIPRKKAVKE